jgi:hypothetical protein
MQPGCMKVAFLQRQARCARKRGGEQPSVRPPCVAASFSKRPRATACVAMLSVMTKITSPHDAPPLLTDDDVKRRVEALVGPALRDRTLWLLFVDGDSRQAPVVMPINDLPRLPDGVITGLGSVL